MQFSNTMKELLKQYNINSIEDIPLNDSYPIWTKRDTHGRMYWGVSDFWNMDKEPIKREQDMSLLEWDGNEINIDAQTDEETADIIKTAIGIMKFWKEQLKEYYSEARFFLFAAFANREMFDSDDNKVTTKSITLRFWAERSCYSIVDLSDIDSWEQPTIIDVCND